MANQRGRTRRAATDQRLLQQTLLGEAIENGALAVFVFDDDRNHVAVNAAASRLTGYSRRELLALDALALSADPDLALRRLDELKAGKRTSGRGAIRHKSGERIPIRYRVTPTHIGGAEFFVSVCWRTDPA